MLKSGIITQARMTSTRLPGKILLPVNGVPVFKHHLNRLAWSEISIYVATTINASDQPIVNLSESLGIPYYRGDEQNVLQRFYECAKSNNLDVVIRVTSDCPLIDGHIIAEGMKKYIEMADENVYYSNCLVRSYPRGMDFEIFSFSQLETAYHNAIEEADKEHVTPFINQNKSGRTKLVHHHAPIDNSDLRWTLDTNDDWILLKSLFEDYNVADLPYTEIVKIVRDHPQLQRINNHIKQKEIKL